jgi:hypothetical protein
MRKILPGLLIIVLSVWAGGANAAKKGKTSAASTKDAAVPTEDAAAPSKNGGLTCVGLYSETDAGHVSFRVGDGSWTVIKVGDKIPADAEIRITVDRDWIEVTQSDNPNIVYEMTGSESGPVTKKVADVLKGLPRFFIGPKPSGDNPDPAFQDKLVVTQYLGRQIYTDINGDERDVKYGYVLDKGGKVTIIAINNTLTLMNASGKVTKVIGPLKFDVEKVLNNEKLYKFLNVPR